MIQNSTSVYQRSLSASGLTANKGANPTTRFGPFELQGPHEKLEWQDNTYLPYNGNYPYVIKDPGTGEQHILFLPKNPVLPPACPTVDKIMSDPKIKNKMDKEWKRSCDDPKQRERGFVITWNKETGEFGTTKTEVSPEDMNSQLSMPRPEEYPKNKNLVVASFHTHPPRRNGMYTPRPSAGDRQSDWSQLTPGIVYDLALPAGSSQIDLSRLPKNPAGKLYTSGPSARYKPVIR